MNLNDAKLKALYQQVNKQQSLSGIERDITQWSHRVSRDIRGKANRALWLDRLSPRHAGLAFAMSFAFLGIFFVINYNHTAVVAESTESLRMAQTSVGPVFMGDFENTPLQNVKEDLFVGDFET